MIPGFNLDIRYKGKTFHIQTEDSGVANPVIMTHLFLFGTILGSRKFDYAHVAGQPNVADLVREHMRAELRAMHAALLAGEFDELARRPMNMKKKGPALPLASDAPEAASQRAAEVATPAVAEEEIDDFGSEDLEPVEDLEEPLSQRPTPIAVAGSLELSMEQVVAATVKVAPPIPGPAAVQDRLSLPNVSPPAGSPVRAPRVTVEFSTDLVSDTRFDDVALAWLLEDVDET
ncbi:MAG: hypothetical protein ACOYM9_03040 [Bradymonadia bacterium]